MKIEGWFQGTWGRIEFSFTVDKEVVTAAGRALLLTAVTLVAPNLTQLVLQLAS